MSFHHILADCVRIVFVEDCVSVIHINDVVYSTEIYLCIFIGFLFPHARSKPFR